MRNDGHAGNGALAVHADHHLNAALRSGRHHLNGIARILAAHQDLIDRVQRGASALCGGGHITSELQSIRKLSTLGVSHHSLHSRNRIFPVDGGNFLLGDGVDAAQQSRDYHTGDQQRHRQGDDVLGVHLDPFLFHFTAHFAAASFLSDFTTPKRVGFVYLSMRGTSRFITMME